MPLACNRSEPQGKVFGKITSAGQPLSGGRILFSNAAQGVHITAPVQPDGSYQLHTARGVGLPLGEYKVSVSPPPVEPTMPGAPKPPPAPQVNIPKKYTRPETSGLTLTVAEGENPFDIVME
jgi:hypothetical protein